MGSDESHFNVSVASDGQSHRTSSTNHNLFEEKGEPHATVSNWGPSAYQPNALPLGQTGSPSTIKTCTLILRYEPKSGRWKGDNCKSQGPVTNIDSRVFLPLAWQPNPLCYSFGIPFLFPTGAECVGGVGSGGRGVSACDKAVSRSLDYQILVSSLCPRHHCKWTHKVWFA